MREIEGRNGGPEGGPDPRHKVESSAGGEELGQNSGKSKIEKDRRQNGNPNPEDCRKFQGGNRGPKCQAKIGSQTGDEVGVDGPRKVEADIFEIEAAGNPVESRTDTEDGDSEILPVAGQAAKEVVCDRIGKADATNWLTKTICQVLDRHSELKTVEKD